MRVFVTGGKGDLGRRVVPRLLAAGHDVLVGTRAPAPRADGAREVLYELDRSGELDGPGRTDEPGHPDRPGRPDGPGRPDRPGHPDAPGHPDGSDRREGSDHLDELLRDVDAVVHLASDGFRPSRDIAAMRQLVGAAGRVGVGHLLYVSIVGVDDVPFPYYRAKLACERLLEESPVAHTVLRATQFHSAAERIASAAMKAPVVLAPRGIPLQTVDAEVVADRVAALVDAGPAGRVRDLGGPEVVRSDDAMRQVVRAMGSRRPVVGVRVPGRVGRAFRRGGVLLGDAGEIAGAPLAHHLDELAAAQGESRRRDGVGSFLRVVGGVFLLVAAWMALAPQGFVDNLAGFGETVDHFVRDLATFTAPLGIALLLAASRPSWRRPVIGLALLQNGLHLVNHVVDIATTDPAWHGPANVAQLAVLEVVLGVAWRITGRDGRTRRARAGTGAGAGAAQEPRAGARAVAPGAEV